MVRARRVMSLPDDVDALLDRVGNASEYISRIVTDRWELWLTALNRLVANGWTSNELLAACEALNGHWLTDRADRPVLVAAELREAQQQRRLCEKWNVSPKRWSGRVGLVRASDQMADALVVLAHEFWSGNAACEMAIRRDEQKASGQARNSRR